MVAVLDIYIVLFTLKFGQMNCMIQLTNYIHLSRSPQQSAMSI